MLRTISLLALALLAHVTLVAALAHACGPQCGNPQFNNNYSNQHNNPQFQLGNRAINGNKNALGAIAKSVRPPQTALANQPATIKPTTEKANTEKPQEQLTEHPSDLPTNDPPLAATVARN